MNDRNLVIELCDTALNVRHRVKELKDPGLVQFFIQHLACVLEEIKLDLCMDERLKADPSCSTDLTFFTRPQHAGFEEHEVYFIDQYIEACRERYLSQGYDPDSPES